MIARPVAIGYIVCRYSDISGAESGPEKILTSTCLPPCKKKKKGEKLLWLT